ncbi:GNAT family N-acetyltransferase [Phytomonospora sp. NPDC050363]|uniref:GNAT family N-acetyltransferase n=1 Tax=Phytomonospora sp. NPDC050363 TaxID=3155642 RepID=UPI00340AA033
MRLYLKPAVPSDAKSIDALLTDHSRAHTGRGSPTGVAKARLRTPGTVSAIVAAADRRAIGFGHVWRDGEVARCLVVARPDVWGGRPIVAALVSFAERRAVSVGAGTLKVHSNATDSVLGDVLASTSFEPVTRISRMRVDLASRPTSVAPPPGVDVGRFDEERDSGEIYAVAHEVFPEGNNEPAWWRDHRENPLRPYDPALWIVARRDGRIVGFALGSRRMEDGGPVGYLGGFGVRESERGHGIGQALLVAMMDAFIDRGFPAMTLSVSTGNRTGALSLYRKFGMTEAPESTEWMKRLG